MKDFGQAELVEAEAIGEPGKRTFRVRVRSGSESAALWLEKEQLAALSLAIRQVLQQTGSKASPSEAEAEPEPAPPTELFPEQPDVDFKIARLGIGYDEQRGLVAIFAYAPDEERDAAPTFTCQIQREQSRVLAQQAEKAVTAGRPVCVLCGRPIDPEGHKCLRRNGHSERPVSRT